MAIYDPAALAIPQRPTYHLQSQTDYEDGDGASIQSLKKPKCREGNYKPAPLRWPFLVCQVLLLLLCISLVACALVLMPNSDTNAVILTPSASTILEKRQQVFEGDGATTGAATVSSAGGDKSTGQGKTGSENIGTVEKATTTAIEVQTTVKKTTAVVEPTTNQSPDSVTSRENAGVVGATQLETTRAKTTQGTQSEVKPSSSGAKETENPADTAAVTTSAKHTQQVQQETISVTTKQTEQATEQNAEKNTRVETTGVETTRMKTAHGETTGNVAQPDSEGNHVPTETTIPTTSTTTREKSDPTTHSDGVKGPVSSQHSTSIVLATSSEEVKPNQGTSLPDTTSTTRLENTQPTNVEQQTPKTTISPVQETWIKGTLTTTEYSTGSAVQISVAKTSTAIEGTTEETTIMQQPPGTTSNITSTSDLNANPTTTSTPALTTSTEVYPSIADTVPHQDKPPTTVPGGKATSTEPASSTAQTAGKVSKTEQATIETVLTTSSAKETQTDQVPTNLGTEATQLETGQETHTTQEQGHADSTNSRTNGSGNQVGTTIHATTILPGASSIGETTTVSHTTPHTTRTNDPINTPSTSSNGVPGNGKTENDTTTLTLDAVTSQETEKSRNTQNETHMVEGKTSDQGQTVSTRKISTTKGIDIIPVMYTSVSVKKTSEAESTEEETKETTSASIVTTPLEMDTKTTLAFSAVQTTIVTQPPPYAVVTDKDGELLTVITTPQPLTYALTYTTQVNDAQATNTGEDDTSTQSQPGEWILVTTVIVARLGGTVTRVTETRPPFTMLTVVDEALVQMVTTPPSEVHELTVGGTPYTYTSFYKSFRLAFATGGSGDFDPSRLSTMKFTKSDAFLGSFLPLILAVVVSMMFRIIDLNVKMYQPFTAMAKEQGAFARNSVTLSFFEGIRSYTTPFSMAFGEGYFAPLLTTILVGASWLLIPLASEAISIKVYGACEEGSDDGCKQDLGVTPGFAYALLAIISVMAVVMLFVVFLLQRWKTGLASSPWSIAAMSLLAMNPQFRAPLVSMPRKTEAGVIPHAQLDKVYGDRRYKLGIYRTADGDEHYAIVPADDSAAGLTADMTPDPVSNGLAGLNGPARARTNIPFVPLKFWSRTIALAVHGAVLGLVAYYQTVSVPYINTFEAFMDGPGIGKRFLFSTIGISMAFWWFYFFASVAAIMPYLVMFGSPQPPDRSILMNRHSNPFTGLVTAIRNRHVFLAIVCTASIFSEFLPMLLANVPFRHVGTLGENSTSSLFALAILVLMVLILLITFFIKWPHMPADPRTIAGATYYVAESTMLGLFEGLGEVGPKVRQRRIRELGRRFGYGDCVSLSGRRRFGVDADGGVLGELAGDDGVIESTFSSMRTKITGTVSSVSRSDGTGMRDPMSGALPSTPSPIPAEDNDTIASRSPTGYLGGTVSGYGRFGPGYEHERYDEGDISQQQPRGLLEEIQYQEGAQPGHFKEARLSDMSGYVGLIEDRPHRAVDEEEYRDYFAQDTGYTGFRLDSTEDGYGNLYPSPSQRGGSTQEQPTMSANFASPGGRQH